jgi:hypothetical protein
MTHPIRKRARDLNTEHCCNGTPILDANGTRKAESKGSARMETGDPGFTRNGAFQNHFPNCNGAADAIPLLASKDSAWIRSDWHGNQSTATSVGC